MVRDAAFGQHEKPKSVDRLGVWLSARRLKATIGSFEGLRVGDFGCGYQATLVRAVLDNVKRAVLVDIALAEDLKARQKVDAIEGPLPEAMSKVETGSLDVAMCVSVLEHLWEPHRMLSELHRVVAPGGTCIINVPSWLGKRFLELSAFRLGLSPADEMNDHKTYYNPSDLWPLLVRAGFRPQDIRCTRHKFGLNTFAVCKAEVGAQ